MPRRESNISTKHSKATKDAIARRKEFAALEGTYTPNMIVTELVVRVNKSENDSSRGILRDARREACALVEAQYGEPTLVEVERVTQDTATFRFKIKTEEGR